MMPQVNANETLDIPNIIVKVATGITIIMSILYLDMRYLRILHK